MHDSTNREPKLIAYYLPQFHPIPENDEWWGKGFTEWRNVARAKPLFRGHYQPHVPADLGFYDLRVPEVRDEQAALAKRYGIYGFCYYYYWFNGKRLLDRPLREVLELGKPDFPFCICWANENWTRRWDGYDQEILMGQEHSPESDERFILDVIPILKDRRYIRVADKPMLLVYKVDLLPNPVETAAAWRRVAAANGIADLHLCVIQSGGTTDPRPFGFDAAIEFPPHGMRSADVERDVAGLTLNFTGRILDYREGANWFLSKPAPDYELHRGLMVAWDNSPRRQNQGYIWANATPTEYYDWLHALVRQSRTRPEASEFIFINAWNEWAEGAHLEPDVRYGRAYLEATKRALRVDPQVSVRSVEQEESPGSGPLVSVIIRSHNDYRYVREAIASVESQTYGNIELVVIDDGSTDGSVAVIERMLSESRFRRVTFRTQPTMGATVTIDRGIMLSKGDYVAILNADDAFTPGRIEIFVRQAAAGRDVFLFSGITFYCTRDKRIITNDELDPRIRSYKDALLLAAATPTAGFALLGANLTVSTSNFFFNRALFEKLKGFSSQLSLTHGWDFVLRATQYVEPQFVPDELLTYRYRSHNAADNVGDRSLLEGRIVLARFIELVRDGTLNELAPTQQNWPLFFDFFCSSVTPWFATDPLVEHLPRFDSSRHVSGNRHVEHVREDAAMQRLQDGLHRPRLSVEPVAQLRREIVHGWAGLHTHRPSRQPDDMLMNTYW